MSRRRLVSALLAGALAVSLVVGAYVYASLGLFREPTRFLVRALPILNITVDVKAQLPAGVQVQADVGRHCGDYFRSGWVDAFHPVPEDTVAALYVRVRGLPPGVSYTSFDADPILVYMPTSSVSLPSRLLPRQELFSLQWTEEGFVVPPGAVLREGEGASFEAHYTWMGEDTSFNVTEVFSFMNAGFWQVHFPASEGLCM